jgi:cyclophilin family peptidyl-prolyl cis-trans isomerase
VKRLALIALAAVSLPALAQPPVVDTTPKLADEHILMRTNRGDLVLSLYAEVAPKHVAQILKLVRLGVYDSTYIHRVEPNFVAQLTNAQNRKEPLSAEQLAAITKIPAEFSTVRHRPGVLSMAREDGDVNSAESSFSFMLAPAPHLDGKYTVFGQVDFGRPLLLKIASEPRDARNAPRSPIVVERATVISNLEFVRMRMAHELRDPLPIPPEEVAAMARAAAEEKAVAATPPAGSAVAMAGIGLMMLCNVIVFLFGAKWPVQTQGAINVLAVLIGCFVLFMEYGTRARNSPIIAIAVFFGIIGLFKLMNRFESPPKVERKPT